MSIGISGGGGSGTGTSTVTTRVVSSSGDATTADQLIAVDATSGNITITLFTASGNTGFELRIKKTDSTANTVIIDGFGTETIDGSTTYTLINQYETLTIVCDGTNWWSV